MIKAELLKRRTLQINTASRGIILLALCIKSEEQTDTFTCRIITFTPSPTGISSNKLFTRLHHADFTSSDMNGSRSRLDFFFFYNKTSCSWNPRGLKQSELIIARHTQCEPAQQNLRSKSEENNYCILQTMCHSENSNMIIKIE